MVSVIKNWRKKLPGSTDVWQLCLPRVLSINNLKQNGNMFTFCYSG